MTHEIKLAPMENVSDYAIELPSLWYDKQFLLDHLNSIDTDSWYLFDCGHVRWTVHESYEHNPPHQDRNRLAILNIAIRGEFGNKSPQTFYDDFDRETHLFDMEYHISDDTNEFAPWLFKGAKVHGVQNNGDPTRAILSCCWRHHTYEDIYNGIKDGTMINWDANERNKRIKFI